MAQEKVYFDFILNTLNYKNFPKDLIKKAENIQKRIKETPYEEKDKDGNDIESPYEVLDESFDDINYICKSLYMSMIDTTQMKDIIDKNIESYYDAIHKYDKRKSDYEASGSFKKLENLDEIISNDKELHFAKAFISEKMSICMSEPVAEGELGVKLDILRENYAKDLSKDLLTKNILDIESLLPEQSLQTAIELANRCAHWYDDKLKEKDKSFYITDRDDLLKYTEGDKQYHNKVRAIFLKKIDELNKLNCTLPENERINFEKVSKYFEEHGDNIDGYLENEEIAKVKNAILKILPSQEINPKTIKDFNEIIKYREKSLEYYTLKGNLDTIELEIDSIARKDQKLTEGSRIEKSTISFLIEDDAVMKDGRQTYRLVTMNKDFYEEYLKYNDSIYLNDAMVDYIAKKNGTYDYDAYGTLADEKTKEYRKSITDYNEKQKVVRPQLTEFEVNAIMAAGNVTIRHVVKDEADKFIKERELDEIEMNPSLAVKSVARAGQAINNHLLPDKHVKEIEGALKNVKKRNETMKNKCKENYEEFIEKNDFIEDYVRDTREVEISNE